VCEAPSLSISACAEGGVVVRVSLSGISLEMNSALSQVRCYSLFWARSRDPERTKCIVLVSCISKSKASSKHPPSGLRVSWVDRRCSNPAHTCTNRVAVVVTLNHGDARMGIDNSRMLRDSLNELLE
jgi:hypothetical protein